MKLLIQNYSNSCSSQPMYFNECLSRVGIDTSIWNLNDGVSVYDKLDSVKPDVIMSSFQSIPPDMIQYLKSSPSIKLIVDITDIDQSMLDNLLMILEAENISCPFLISQEYEFLRKAKTDKKEIVSILPCYDVFTPQNPVPEFNVSAAVISNRNSKKFEETCSLHEVYHKIVLADNQDLNFDLQANVINMNSLYNKYDEIVVVGDVNFACSQIFFDGFVKSKKITVKVPEEQQELFNKVLSTLFYEEDEEPSLEKIEFQIKKNHSCFNRVSLLAKKLGEESASSKLLEMAKQL